MPKLTSTGDLLTALEEHQAKGFAAVALVFLIDEGKGTELIFAGDGDAVARLAAMNGLLRTGAQPVGFLGCTPSGKLSSWPLPNYKDNEQIKTYLEKVERECRKTVFMLDSVAEIHAGPMH